MALKGLLEKNKITFALPVLEENDVLTIKDFLMLSADAIEKFEEFSQEQRAQIARAIWEEMESRGKNLIFKTGLKKMFLEKKKKSVDKARAEAPTVDGKGSFRVWQVGSGRSISATQRPRCLSLCSPFILLVGGGGCSEPRHTAQVTGCLGQPHWTPQGYVGRRHQ